MHLEQPWMDNTSPFPDPDFPSQGTPLVVVLLLQSCVNKFTTNFLHFEYDMLIQAKIDIVHPGRSSNNIS